MEFVTEESGPRLERAGERLRVVHAGQVIADAPDGWRLIEPGHPPAYYIEPTSVKTELLRPSDHMTVCPFKGQASYFDLVVDGTEVPQAAWYYPDPKPEFADIANCVAFYAGKVDECYVGDKRVLAEASDFYGGWVTEARGSGR